jgi:hypothetical protein
MRSSVSRTEDSEMNLRLPGFACILRDHKTGRFHPALMQQCPLNSLAMPFHLMTTVRVNSHLVHGTGYETFGEAVEETRALAFRFPVQEHEGFADAVWGGQWSEENLPITWVVPNWSKVGRDEFCTEAGLISPEIGL